MAVPETSRRHQKRSTTQQLSGTAVRNCFLQAALMVVSVTLLMILVIRSGALDAATVELGLEHYAEKQPSWLPHWGLPMPLNTLINFGYMLFGAHWCLLVTRALLKGAMAERDAYFFFVFNTMGFVYGFVQLYRIVGQTLGSAILDQWYTLPLFIIVYAWAHSALGRSSWSQFYFWMSVSVLSYGLTLLTPVGFELALGVHILLAVSGGCLLYTGNPSDPALRCFMMAVFNCCGFVFLKLMDHHLPHVHWIFSYVSGHFLSKICDVLQFHYVSKFFFTIACKSTGTDINRRMKTN